MTAPLLTVEHLTVECRGTTLLRDVSLEVPVGSAVGVVGETGSGKSMTCRAVTGLLDRIGGRVTDGTIEFAGTDLVALGRDGWRTLRQRDLGFVPQSSIGGLDPVTRVGRQLAETVALTEGRAARGGRIVELLEAVHLPADERVLNLYPHELSGGMRQRVMIALALAGRPRLLLADEPTTALDVTIQRSILALLAELRRQMDMSLLLISHDLGVVRSMCDWIVVMYAGMTVESGPAEQVLNAPEHPYTQALVAAQPALADGRRLVAIPGHPPEPAEVWDGCPFAPRCPQAADVCRGGKLELQPVGTMHSAACRRLEERVG